MMDLITGMVVKSGHYGYGFHFLWKIVFLAFVVFWVIMLFNCLQRKFKVAVDKVAWIIVLVFLPVIGAVIYLFWLYYGLKR